MPDAPRPPVLQPPVSPWRAGLMCRCPACGKGPLYSGFLTIASRCRECGEDLAACEQGDGPAVFVILILGFIVTGAALVVEVMFSPPYWLHLAIWPPLILGGALAMLRPFKGVLVATHFRHRKGHVER
jgi:uncharacterized protein (DUF983 family)